MSASDVPTAPTPPKSHGQTFLVGEEIYLRRIEKRDARFVMSVRNTPYPQSPAVAEEWIAQGLRDKPFGVWTVVRRQDDRPVGSMTLHHRNVAPLVDVHIDPLYPSAGRWMAEVYRLVVPWLRDDGIPRLSRAAIEAGRPVPAMCPRLRFRITDAPVTDPLRPAGTFARTNGR